MSRWAQCEGRFGVIRGALRHVRGRRADAAERENGRRPQRSAGRPLRFVLWFLVLNVVTLAVISATSAGLTWVEALVLLLMLTAAAGFLARRR